MTWISSSAPVSPTTSTGSKIQKHPLTDSASTAPALSLSQTFRKPSMNIKGSKIQVKKERAGYKNHGGNRVLRI